MPHRLHPTPPTRRQHHHQPPTRIIHQPLHRRLHRLQIRENMHPPRPRPQFPERLHVPHQQLAQHRHHRPVHSPVNFMKRMPVLRHPRPRQPLHQRQLPQPQALHRLHHLTLVPLHHRIPIALLIARRRQRPRRQRIILRRRQLLLDQTPQHPRLRKRQRHHATLNTALNSTLFASLSFHPTTSPIPLPAATACSLSQPSSSPHS